MTNITDIREMKARIVVFGVGGALAPKYLILLARPEQFERPTLKFVV